MSECMTVTVVCEIHDVIVDCYRRFYRIRNSVQRRTTNSGGRM